MAITAHPRSSPEEDGSPYVEELLRTRIAPKTNGAAHFTSAIIEPYTSLSGSSNFSGNRTKDATPRRAKGEPNLLLWKDGPIL